MLDGTATAETIESLNAVTGVGLVALAVIGLFGVVNLVRRAARPWFGNPDERPFRRSVKRYQMSLLRTGSTSLQAADGRTGPEASANEVGGRGIRPDGDASGPIICSTGDVARPATRDFSVSKPFRSWRLWTVPRAALALMLAVEIGAVVATLVVPGRRPITPVSLRYFVVLVVLGILAAELSRSVERLRRWFSDGPHVNMSSIWTVSAALLTSPVLAGSLAVILYGHLWTRSWYRVAGVDPFRVVFSASVVVLSCQAAGVVAGLLPDPMPPVGPGARSLLTVLLVIVVYSAVNSGLAGVALALLRDQRSVRGVLGSWQENSIEYATLCTGVLTAALLTWRPWLILLVLPPLYVLHRSVLVRQLEHAVTIDEKTGLLNVATWRSLAAAEFERARRHRRSIGLLMADLDHFTQVNGRFGRAVGDAALRAVGDAMMQEVRSGDLCGRLGGEEFVILLAGTSLAEAVGVAERICQRVRALPLPDNASGSNPDGFRLSVSIGAATYPDAGIELDDVLLAADNALFAAKDAGRDRATAVQFTSNDENRPARRPG